MRTLSAVLALVAAVASTAGCGGASAELMAAPVAPDPRIGALFLDGTELHTCSASVLHSTTSDLILTAAHCVADGWDTTFIPGADDDSADSDAWNVDDVYLDPRWLENQDPHADYAILRVSRDDGEPIESAVGTGLRLGTAPAEGAVVTVTGYPMGIGGPPIGCEAETSVDDGYPLLECDGMVPGTSGSPWLAGTTVTGVIGGLDGGGCEDDVSYSAPFDGHVTELLARAEAGGPGDHAPESVDDC